MPFVKSNGIRLSYRRSGHGEPVLLIMGSSAAGHVWSMHQTPALNRAGYETITFDNRGVPPSDAPEGDYTLAEMVADTAGLIEALDLGPCHLAGASLGAMIAQELALGRPDLVRSAVLIAPGPAPTRSGGRSRPPTGSCTPAESGCRPGTGPPGRCWRCSRRGR
ncbi:alpha/beta fold hydrolase [Actinomadura madurae]|uniref:alpha/beta fold hydrolase n=1 Tax=Actinomadura madurae TaxID=1993 RepID=UPI0020D21DC7